MNSPIKCFLNIYIKPLFINVFILFSFSHLLSAQKKYKPFEGAIYYDVFLYKHADSLPIKVNYLTLRIKDSLARIDTHSDAFGNQSTIKNLNRKRAYILLKSKDTFYAVKSIDTSIVRTKYAFKKIRKSKKIGDYKMKAIRRMDDNGEIDTIYYLPAVNPIYLNIFKGVNGLPVGYKVPISETAYYYYQVIKIEKEVLDKKLFSIPTIFKMVTMDEFILLNQ